MSDDIYQTVFLHSSPFEANYIGANMVRVGQRNLVFATTFTVRDLEEVELSDIQSLPSYRIILTFDPKVPEGEQPGVHWSFDAGTTRISCRGFPKSPLLANAKVAIANFATPTGNKELSLVIVHSFVGDSHHVGLELYLGPKEP